MTNSFRIKSLELRNFKSIGNLQRIDFAPITLLLGPNSAGKSSIFDALMTILRETNPEEFDRSSRLGGITYPLAPISRLRRIQADSEVSSTVRVFYGVSSSDIHLSSDLLMGEILACREHSAGDSAQESLLRVLEAATVNGEVSVGIGFRWAPRLEAHVLGGETDRAAGSDWRLAAAIMEIWLGGELAMITDPDDRLRPVVLRLDHPCIRNQIDYIDELEAASETSPLDLLAGFGICPEIRSAFGEDAVLAAFHVDDVSGDVLIPGEDDVFQDAGYHFAEDEDYFLRAQSIRPSMPDLARTLRAIHLWVWSQLQRGLESASSYVPPKREIRPSDVVSKRGKGINAGDADSEAGTNLSRILPSTSSLDRIGLWFSDPERLDLGVRLVHESIVLLDLEDPVVMRTRRRGGSGSELERMIEGGEMRSRLGFCPIDSTGIVLDVNDLGEGIGQIVPVVVAMLDADAALVVIEQPEIHLHPRVAARLGDLLVYGWNRAKHLDVMGILAGMRIIETHSEVLVLRILRRIREAYRGRVSTTIAEYLDEINSEDMRDVMGEIGQGRFGQQIEVWLQPDDVAVIYAEPSDDGTRYHRLRIGEDGEFLDPWPDGFFAERVEELRP